ncbi:MAG: hypothetical protein R2867_38615 [Caldilineaceae bacterium]
MSILRPLAIRTLTMIGVFFVVMLMLVLTLGLTGYSDRILNAVVGEQLRGTHGHSPKQSAIPMSWNGCWLNAKPSLKRSMGSTVPWCGCRGWCCGDDVRSGRGAQSAQL